jgi:CHASE2 domain-containing sensor protein
MACFGALVIITFVVAGPSSDAPSKAGSRILTQFSGVGSLSSFGVGGFSSFYAGWWLPMFPTSCFTIGTQNPLYLTQCAAFTTSF